MLTPCGSGEDCLLGPTFCLLRINQPTYPSAGCFSYFLFISNTSSQFKSHKESLENYLSRYDYPKESDFIIDLREFSSRFLLLLDGVQHCLKTYHRGHVFIGIM